MRRGPPPSLKARALQLLAQRDQSRVELRRKLLQHARKRAEDPLTGPFPQTGEEETGEAEIDAVLDWLEAHRYLSTARFVESRIHARQERFGNQRIRAELAQHGAALTPEQSQRLRESELERAAAILARRYPHPPQTPQERAARQRFLTARGFTGDVVARALRRGPADKGDAED